MSEQNYIFGYGSLINKESRAITTSETSEAIPVRVKGLERCWNALGDNKVCTVLGAIINDSATCNGVVIPVTASELELFDQREIGYSRIRIREGNIMPLADTPVPEGPLWAYVNSKTYVPSPEAPLIQSYIDVVLTGCLSFSEEFAREFIASTYGWSTDWLDDRQHPYYVRSMVEVPLAPIIDRLLKENVPGAFYARTKSEAVPETTARFPLFSFGWLKTLWSFLFTISGS